MGVDQSKPELILGEEEKKFIGKNSSNIDFIKNSIVNMEESLYTPIDSDKLYYKRPEINRFFTGSDDIFPNVDGISNNNTLYYSKPDINEFITGKKDGSPVPGPYAMRSDMTDYYSIRDMEREFITMEKMERYPDKATVNDTYLLKGTGGSDMTLELLGANGCHFEVMDSRFNIIKSGSTRTTNRWCPDIGKFAIETSTSTKHRRFFGYITSRGFLNMLAGGPNQSSVRYIQIIFKGPSIFDINKPMFANVDLQYENNPIPYGVGRGSASIAGSAIIKALGGGGIILGSTNFKGGNINRVMIEVEGFAP